MSLDLDFTATIIEVTEIGPPKVWHHLKKNRPNILIDSSLGIFPAARAEILIVVANKVASV